MRKVILYIAMSLDGYIADTKGGIGWLSGDGSQPTSTGSYPEFIDSIDTVILGYTTYHQIITELSPENWVYAGKRSYVLTHRNEKSTDDITFIDENILTLLDRLKVQSGKHIWICGGANIVNQLVSQNAIDQYRIVIIPTILGDGIPLFDKHSQEVKLRAVSQRIDNGIIEIVYERR